MKGGKRTGAGRPKGSPNKNQALLRDYAQKVAAGDQLDSPLETVVQDREVPQVPQVPKETIADVLTHKSLRPTVQAALTLKDYNKPLGEMSLRILVDDLAKQCDLANEGNLKRAEALLMAQAHTLDAIFHTLARRAQSVEYLNQFDVYLRLGLKAQSQCRATLETLAAIKYPQSVAFVRQANIAHGPQQVNNGTTQTDAAPRARETKNQRDKLLEAQNGQRVDLGAPGAASKANSSLEAVATIHWAKDASREEAGFAKR